MKATDAMAELHRLASPEIAASSARYFKMGPGEYGEGDVFIGVRVPVIRKLAKEFTSLQLNEIEVLLHSEVHESRMLALLVLVNFVAHCDEGQRKAAYEFYLDNTSHINNWDLVDSSAPAVVGGFLREKSREPLLRLAQSASMWERRIAIVSTQHFIRIGQFDDTITISRILLADREDLLQKATGWMLREVGDEDELVLTRFLDEHRSVMPRTMLRYAIEHFTDAKRRYYLAR